MPEQSYDRIASGEALPSGESAYGYSMSDPYTDAYRQGASHISG
jgi:hypothetical protein